MAELPEPLRFRPACATDYPSIGRLISGPRDLFLAFPTTRFPLTPRQLRRLAEKRFDLSVVEYRRAVVGFADLYDTRPAHWAFIGNVIVDTRHRGKAIGRDLLRYMLGLVFAVHNLPQARISVFEDNVPARALYGKLGSEATRRKHAGAPTGNCIRCCTCSCRSSNSTASLIRHEGTRKPATGTTVSARQTLRSLTTPNGRQNPDASAG